MNRIKLAIITTHPIQYYAPVFKQLTENNRIDVKVFYTFSQHASNHIDSGFGHEVSWDVPLLNGYSFAMVPNAATVPTLDSFSGISNPSLINEVTEWGANALLVYGWNYKAHLSAMRYFKNKVPVFFRGDSTLLNEKPGWRKFVRRLFLNRIYRYVDTAFYVGENNKEYFLKHGLNEVKLAWAPHSIDHERFQADENSILLEASERRVELGIPVDDLVILFAGKFESQKNPLLLMRAAVAFENIKVHFVFAGAGHLEQEMRAMASDHKHIHLLPFQNQSKMPLLYRLGDVFCLPSQSETWGLAINEAMVCGCAVLVSNKVGCAPDLVDDGVNGFMFETENVDSLNNCIRQFIDDRGLAKSMGQKSREKIAAWDIRHQVEKIEQRVQKVVDADLTLKVSHGK